MNIDSLDNLEKLKLAYDDVRKDMRWSPYVVDANENQMVVIKMIADELSKSLGGKQWKEVEKVEDSKK